MDKTQKILLVDDIHLIKQNHLGKFIEGVESEFGYIIYTSSTNVVMARKRLCIPRSKL